MADSRVFDVTCEELEKRTPLSRLEARGTVRIALKSAGLSVEAVDAPQMTVVLQRVLADELESRAIAAPQETCAEIAAVLARTRFEATPDRTGDAARTLSRLGS